MYGYKRHLIVAVALGGCLATLTGSALAAPPAAPPGQEQKAEQAPPGQEKKAEQATSNGVNATTEGVKPSSTTKKDTKTTAGARPDVSKRYGNGKTAGQIATSRGAPGSTEIRGPGNSQPHKVCKNGHWVDVHAVKTYSDNTCTGQSSTSSTAAPAPMATATPTAGVSPQTSTPAGSSVSPAASAAGTSAPAGGVLGAQHTASGTGGSQEAGGVAGAFATIGNVAAGSLPFTGFPLWAAFVFGLVAIALGVTLWRRTHSATTRDVV